MPDNLLVRQSESSGEYLCIPLKNDHTDYVPARSAESVDRGHWIWTACVCSYWNYYSGYLHSGVLPVWSDAKAVRIARLVCSEQRSSRVKSAIQLAQHTPSACP